MRVHNLQDTVWTCFSPTERIEYVNGMKLLSDTSFMIAGYAYDTSLQLDIPFIQTYNVNGTLITSNYLEQYPGHKTEELIPYFDGTFLMTGNTRDPETNEQDIWLGQFDSTGKLLDYYIFKTPGYELPRAMCLSSSQQVMIYGVTIDQDYANKNAVLLKLNPMGNSLSPDTIQLTCGKDSLILLEVPYFGERELSYSWIPEDGTGQQFSSNPIDLQLKSPENYLVSVSDGTFAVSDTIFFKVPAADYQISFSASQQFFDNPPFNPVFENLTPQGDNLEFTWHFGDNDSLVSKQARVQHEYLYNGSYDIMLIASDYGCPDTLIIPDMIECSGGDWPLSLNSESSGDLRVYPNPASHNLTISSENPDLRIEQIAIYDNSGRLVKTVDECVKSPINLDVQEFHPGLYYIKLINENEEVEFLGKFIVE